MRKRGFVLAVGAVALLAGTGAGAAGDPAAGREKAAACAGCHGPDGNSMVPQFPKLAGQHAGYIVKQLKDFKEGRRKDPTMAPMAAPLSEADMADLAAFYREQAVKPGKADPAKVELGERVWRAGNEATGVPACTACHGPSGRGNPAAGFPALAGQHAAYTLKQLKAFASGARANDAGAMMRTLARKMSQAEMEAVASFIEGLQP